MGAVPIKASDVTRRLTGIWRFGLPPGLQQGANFLPYAAFLSMLDEWIDGKTNSCAEAKTTGASA